MVDGPQCLPVVPARGGVEVSEHIDAYKEDICAYRMAAAPLQAEKCDKQQQQATGEDLKACNDAGGKDMSKTGAGKTIRGRGSRKGEINKGCGMRGMLQTYGHRQGRMKHRREECCAVATKSVSKTAETKKHDCIIFFPRSSWYLFLCGKVMA